MGLNLESCPEWPAGLAWCILCGRTATRPVDPAMARREEDGAAPIVCVSCGRKEVQLRDFYHAVDTLKAH